MSPLRRIEENVQMVFKPLTLSMLGKNRVDDILKYFSCFFSQKKVFSISCKIVSLEEDLHEVSNPIF